MAQRKPKARPQHLVSTPPRRSQCQRCAAEILTCLVKGTQTRIDPVHVNLRGEVMVLVAGMPTYSIPILGKGYATQRNSAMIIGGLPKYAYLHPGHQCGFDWSSPDLADGRRLFSAPINPSFPPPF